MLTVDLLARRQKWLRYKRMQRRAIGQCLIEALIAGLILIPIALASIDLAALVMGGQICNDLAKQAARAASIAADQGTAQTAMATVQSQFHASSTFQSLSLTMLKFDNTADGLVSVGCSVTVNLPVSIPLLHVGPDVPIQTQHTEPIVGITPSP